MYLASKFRRSLRLCLAAALALAALPTLAADLTDRGNLQDLRQLEALAQAEAARQLPPMTTHERLVAGPIEDHVRLERCSQEVKSGVSPGQHMRDRILVELRCTGLPAWHLYVPVRVVGSTQVTLAAHAIVPGTVLTQADLRVEQRDVPGLPPGYLDDPSVAVGLTASRPISSGAVITNQLLVGSKAVQRGQTVTLVADADGMSVRMQGRALSDGLINQRIKVENLSSGKVVEGIARSEQVVEIILQ
jgi:flagellar basal body P-ring formation protein FlgA